MKKLLLILTFLNFCISAYSQCDNYTVGKAKYMAKEFAYLMVENEFDGGTNVYAQVYNCDYNEYSGELEFDATISFNGDIFTSNYYEVRGHLTIAEDGTCTFLKSWLNETADDYVSMKKWAMGGFALVYVLGTK